MSSLKRTFILSLFTFSTTFFVFAEAKLDPHFVWRRDDLTMPKECRNLGLDHFKNLLKEKAGVDRFFAVGTKGAIEKGFDFEYPVLRRGGAQLDEDISRVLWGFLSNYNKTHKTVVQDFRKVLRASDGCRECLLGTLVSDFEFHLNSSFVDFVAELTIDANFQADLITHYKVISTNFADRDIAFGNEGDLLEAWSPLAVGADGRSLLDLYPAKDFFITGGLEYRVIVESGDRGRTLGELDIIVGDRLTCDILAIGESKLGLKSLSKAKSQLRRFQGFLQRRLEP